MTVLEILQYPDPKLRRKAIPITNIKNPKIQKLIDDMFETMYSTSNCAALSATQLNITYPFCITVINQSPQNDIKQTLCLINPKIINQVGTTSYTEGCMSVCPNEIYATVKRAEKITFRALDREGNPIEIATNGFFAICVQHEIDHLNGILYIDHLSRLKRRMLDKKIRKIHRLEQNNAT